MERRNRRRQIRERQRRAAERQKRIKIEQERRRRQKEVRKKMGGSRGNRSLIDPFSLGRGLYTGGEKKPPKNSARKKPIRRPKLQRRRKGYGGRAAGKYDRNFGQ